MVPLSTKLLTGQSGLVILLSLSRRDLSALLFGRGLRIMPGERFRVPFRQFSASFSNLLTRVLLLLLLVLPSSEVIFFFDLFFDVDDGN